MTLLRASFLESDAAGGSCGMLVATIGRLRLAQSFGGDVKSCLADRCYVEFDRGYTR
jgi:hypothetical protein